MGALFRLAAADFWDRVRRPAYAAILCAAVVLGYLATPGKDAGWVVMQIGRYRGEYNSAYIGMVVALAGAVWLCLGGFYVVRNAISRDESTGVGRLLAATPISNATYLLAKFLSSVLVLASMLGVLVVTAVVMQLARGEVLAIDPVELLKPFVLIALPLMVFTAAAALLSRPSRCCGRGSATSSGSSSGRSSPSAGSRPTPRSAGSVCTASCSRSAVT